MLSKLKETWDALDVHVIVNKQELALGMALCALAGLSIGMLISPRKQVCIGSNNGNNNTGTLSAAPETEAEAEEE